MEMKNGIKPLVEVVVIEVIQFNKPQMVVISLQDIQVLLGMVVMMSG
jgi:hypothetical protein